MSSKKLIIFLVIAAVLIIGLLIATSFLGKHKSEVDLSKKVKPITLTYWRTTDSPGDVSDIINSFHQRYSHISIAVRQIKPEEYERALLEAWAEDRGPDIFSIPLTMLGKYQSKIYPLPSYAVLEVGRKYVTQGLKEETKITLDKISLPNLRQLKETYIDAVSSNIISPDGKIYGFPLALDTLVMYYNRDLLNNAGIAEVPQTWQEFVEEIYRLTILDREGNFVQSGANLGGVDNISHLTDTVALLMMQNGTQMFSNGKASFNQPLAEDPSYFPGVEAVRFYTDFSRQGKETYTWNEAMPKDIEAFISGKLAFYFGWASERQKIRQLAPKLNFDSAPVPQIADTLRPVNIANYNLEVVSFKTKYPDESWAFLMEMTKPEVIKSYLAKTKYPTVHRSLINWQLEDYDLSPFVNGVLTAKVWYTGKNYSLVEEAFKEMIRDVILGRRETILDAINFCAQKVNLTL